MLIQTFRFGEVEVKEEDIYVFPAGIPGFEDLKRYVTLQPSPDIPFCYLQSIDDGELAFLITNPFVYYPDYEFQLSDAQQDELAVGKVEELSIWSIVTAQQTLQDATMNLKAPVVLNTKRRCGKQILLHDTHYTTKHPLLHPANSG
jgi:flagellar assembly factor FliW